MSHSDPVITARGVGVNFGRVPALKGVDLDLKAGEILAVIGGNGAGKTTLVNVLSGSLHGWDGHISVLGQSLRGLMPHDIARLGLARTFQIPQPFAGMRVVENVMVGALFGAHGITSARAARAKAEEVLAHVGLIERMTLYPDELNIPDIKRLEVARALAMNPRVLLLDEVMAGLSPSEINALIDIFWRIRAAGVGILVIEHMVQAIAKLCDRIVVLHNGAEIAQGLPDEVLCSKEVIAAYLGPRFAAKARAGAFGAASPLDPSGASGAHASDTIYSDAKAL